jgi:LAGLIDADG-like domain
VPHAFADDRRKTTLSYLAGLLEGEGSFLKPPPSSPDQSAVALSMTDRDVVQRTALLLEATCWTVANRQKPHHKIAYTTRVRGRRAVEVMEALYPLMGARRQRQITAACEARSLTAHRVPYVTEIAEMSALKASGTSRQDLASRYQVHVRSLDRLLREAAKPDTGILAQAARIAEAEAAIDTALGGNCDLAWLAGIIEGEGAIYRDGEIRVSMTDKDVMERVATLFGGHCTARRTVREGWSQVYDARVGGQRAEEVLEQILGAFGERRRERAASALTARRDARSARASRNSEIVRRLQAGEPGPSVARDYGMTHQNVYYIRKTHGSLAACPRGEGTACKAGYAGSNPVAASMRRGFKSGPRLQSARSQPD